MLWSLLRVLLFVAVVATLTFGASLLIETGAGVWLVLADTEIRFGPLQALVAVLILLLCLWLVLKLVGLLIAVLKFLSGDETALSRYFDRNRERKGHEALAAGMLALASGEGRLAMTKIARAEKLLQKPELTDLLLAQAAEMTGDKARALEVYKRLLGDDRTRFVGVRGILKQKLQEGDTDTALKLAEKAFALNPAHREVQDLLLQLQAEHADWRGARKTLEAKTKAGHLPRDVFRRRDAVLALQEAKEILREGNTIEAREAAIAANRRSPDLIPAAAMAARSYIAAGQPRYASRVLKKAWEAQPHPELAAAYAEIAPDETPAERRARFEGLLNMHPDHEEARLILAELNIAAEDFPAARRALGEMADTHPTARVLTIMAAVERGEGADDAVVRGWLARALIAPRGPQWVCDNCHNIQSGWTPVCDNCGGFDTLSWKEPPEHGGPSPIQTEMLPLIVGLPRAPAADETPEIRPAATAEAVEDVEIETVEEQPPLDLDALRKAEN